MDFNIHYLKIAIARSRESAQQGRFPAGAIVVADYLGQPPFVSGISGDGKDFRHAEVRAIESAIELADRGLQDAVLYASMEPCLMCLTTAYWAGIRKIVYAIRRSEVDPGYYESNVIATEDLRKALNQDIEFIHLSDLEREALDVVHEWEKENQHADHN